MEKDDCLGGETMQKCFYRARAPDFISNNLKMKKKDKKTSRESRVPKEKRKEKKCQDKT